jgi:threonine/homoserine/homoserine lactone efflux protein
MLGLQVACERTLSVFDTPTLLLFISATFALNIAPGPDVLYVLANSARHGSKGGALAALGISCGIVLHTCLAAFGVAALLLAHPWALQALRTAGAVYLIGLGIAAFRPSRSQVVAETALPAGWRILARGFVTNAFNPKVALFFLAFLPQFISAGRVSPTLQVLTLGAIFILSGTLVNIAYALAGGWVSATLRRDARWQRRLDRLSGSILVLLGARLLVPTRTV